jgi:predicted lactoylglutathione lyase
MTPQRITLVTLGVDSLERAKTFYCALGWTPAPSETESIVFYQLNGLVLGLFGRDALAKDQERPASELGTGAMTLALNMPDRKGVDAAYQRALDAGAAPIKAPKKFSGAAIPAIMAIPTAMSGRLLTIPSGP